MDVVINCFNQCCYSNNCKSVVENLVRVAREHVLLLKKLHRQTRELKMKLLAARDRVIYCRMMENWCLQQHDEKYRRATIEGNFSQSKPRKKAHFLTDEQNRTIQRRMFNHETINDICSICYLNYRLGETVGQLPCNHIFHFECIVRCLVYGQICPNCRRIYPAFPIKKDDDEAHFYAVKDRLRKIRRTSFSLTEYYTLIQELMKKNDSIKDYISKKFKKEGHKYDDASDQLLKNCMKNVETNAIINLSKYIEISTQMMKKKRDFKIDKKRIEKLETELNRIGLWKLDEVVRSVDKDLPLPYKR
ncbi:hypothetical protein SNEBB_008496 [Seison nebaliae]|nr:hypothetical protein SNEBB_008496 [Seison nebaliae]